MKYRTEKTEKNIYEKIWFFEKINKIHKSSATMTNREKREDSDNHQHFPGSASDKESTCQDRRQKTLGFDPWVGKIPWGRKRQPTPVFLPREFHKQRSLIGSQRVGHRT